MSIFSINILGRNTNVESAGATTVSPGSSTTGSTTTSSSSSSSGSSAPSDVSSWASELGLGSFQSASSNNGATWYAFTGGSLDVDNNTGAMIQVDESGTQAPWNVTQLAVQQGLGALQSTSQNTYGGTTYQFASGSITCQSNGVVIGQTGSNNLDSEIQNMGSNLGFGSLNQVSTTSDNQRCYSFQHGTIWANPSTGGVNWVQPSNASSGFDGNVAAVAYLRGLGAFKSLSTSGSTTTFQFASGSVSSVLNSDGSRTVTGVSIN